MRFNKKIVAASLSGLLLASSVSGIAIGAISTMNQASARVINEVMYLNGNKEALLNLDNAVVVSDSTTSLGNGAKTTWYVVNEDVTISRNLQASGTLNIILCDGVTFETASITGEGAEIRVYTQSTGKEQGKWNIKAFDLELGFNDNSIREAVAPRFTMYGGIITATGSSGFTGTHAFSSNVTVYGGSLRAKGGSAIFLEGKGEAGTAFKNTLNVYGGTVVAEGGKGGSSRSTIKTLNFSRGDVTIIKGKLPSKETYIIDSMMFADKDAEISYKSGETISEMQSSKVANTWSDNFKRKTVLNIKAEENPTSIIKIVDNSKIADIYETIKGSYELDWLYSDADFGLELTLDVAKMNGKSFISEFYDKRDHEINVYGMSERHVSGFDVISIKSKSILIEKDIYYDFYTKDGKCDFVIARAEFDGKAQQGILFREETDHVAVYQTVPGISTAGEGYGLPAETTTQTSQNTDTTTAQNTSTNTETKEENKLKGSITIDTANYVMDKKGLYDIGITVKNDGKTLSAAEVKKLVEKGVIVVSDSRNGSIVNLSQLDNGNFRVEGKNYGTSYIVYKVMDGNKEVNHASVKVDVVDGAKAHGTSVRNTSLFDSKLLG